MHTGVVLLAAGSGKRMGGQRPKQFLSLNGKPLFLQAFSVFERIPTVKEIVVVVSPESKKFVQSVLKKNQSKKRISIVSGGRERGDSVRNGVLSLSPQAEVVLVHDSARPMVTEEIVKRVERAAQKHGVSLAAWPLADTLKLANANKMVEKTIPRKDLWLAQTPQGFRRHIALECLLKPSATATDDVELAQRKGHKVSIVEGSATNFKVTYPTDLELCRLISAAGDKTSNNASTRTGFGFDSHLFSDQGTLTLGGLKFKAVPALKGHSDGDALLHAVIDALLGAAALGDIGDMFPDTSKKTKGISSEKMLASVMSRLREFNWAPSHVDITILANKPKISPVRSKLQKRLANNLGLQLSQVSIKAKTQEGLSIFQSPGGIAVWAVATVYRCS